MKRLTAFILAAVMTANLASCGKNDLMLDIEPQEITTSAEKAGEGQLAAADFAIRLFRQCVSDEDNILISPISVMAALSMTANGAKGETLEQMETVLGADTAALNDFMHDYLANTGEQLKMADGIWFKDGFDVSKDFLQTNADYYNAEIRKGALDDRTLREINGWVKDRTDEMIPEMLQEIHPATQLCLINAAVLNAPWANAYKENQIENGTFTTSDGGSRPVKMMCSVERKYLEDENARGFIKESDDRQYQFVALLPHEGMTVSEYASSLTAEKLTGLLTPIENTRADARLPQFSCDCSYDMIETLKTMGMADLFSPEYADLSGIGYHPDGIYVGQMLHKTAVELNEKGFKAAAASYVGFPATAALNQKEPEIIPVHLDRPFIYMIWDTRSNIPVFIGCVNDIGE